MASSFYRSLLSAIHNDDPQSVAVLLESSNSSCSSITVGTYKEIVGLGKNCDDDCLGFALSRYLFLPTAKGEYPIILLAGKRNTFANEQKLREVLDFVDYYFENEDLKEVLLTLDKTHEKAIETLLYTAGESMEELIFHICYHEKVNKDVRDIVTLWAAGTGRGGLKEETRPFLAKHNYTLGEIDKISSNLVVAGLFTMLFFPQRIPFEDYTPPKENKFDDMVYLRYLYDNGVPPREMGKLRSILVDENTWSDDRLMALKVFSAYHSGCTANILKYLSDDGCYVSDNEFYHIYPIDETDKDSFFHQCLRNHQELAYAASIACYLSRTCSPFYLDIMLDLFDKLDANLPDNNTVLVAKAIREMMDTDETRYKYGDGLRRELMKFAIRKYNGKQTSTYGFIRCLGGDAVVKVKLPPLHQIPEDTQWIPGICIIIKSAKFFITEKYGDVYGQKKYAIDQGDNGILFVGVGMLYELKNVIVYNTLEDAIKAPFD